MFKRYFHLLRNYNRICVNFHSISYRFVNHSFEKTKYISFNNHNIQQFNFHGSVASSLPLSLNTLESKIINLCIYLKNRRAILNDIEQIIKIYEETDHALLNDVDLMLLKCCGELLPDVDVKTRRKLTERVWNLIQSKGCQLTSEHYNTLLAVYAENSELINPHEFLNNMKVKPDNSIYCSLLYVLLKIEDRDLIFNILSKMEENIYSWSKEIFDAVIEVHAMQGNITEAYKIIAKMQSLGIMPSPETYLCLAYGFAKLGDITNIIQIYEEHQPSIANLMKVIKIISFYGHGKHIPSILKFLPKLLKEKELFMINNTIIQLIYSGERTNAFKIISHLPMHTEIMDACIEYVKCFVREEIQLNTPDQDILQVVRELMDTKHSPQIINKATEVALCHNKEALALMLFEDMRKNNIPVRSHYYWPLLLQAHKRLEKDKTYSLISHMLSLDIEIDEDTFSDYIFPFLDVTDPVTTTKALINAGINYSIANTNMAAFLLRNNKLKDVISFCSTFKIKLDFRESCLQDSLIEGFKRRTSLSTYVLLMLQIPYTNNPPFLYILNAWLNDVNHSEELEEFIDFLKILKEQHKQISKTDIEFIKIRINEINTDATIKENIENLLYNISNEEIDLNFINRPIGSVSVLSSYPHPSKMNSKELQNHIIELKNKNMNFRGSSRKLLQQYCLKNDLKAAEELKQEMISNNFEWTPGMSASLFILYVNKNILDKAEVELAEIQNNFSYFQIDGTKILSYAIALVKNNRLEDAFNAIKNIQNVNKKVNLTSKCLQLLTAIADSEYYDSTEKMLETLAKKNYCIINNILLNPLLQKHLKNNDIESAIDVFLHCANKYKQTPCKQKIVLSLISNLDSSIPVTKEGLLKVIKCISNIHGKEVAILHLITALAETGQILKLQEIFQTEKVNMNLLTHHLQNNIRNEQFNAALTIFEATKNMGEVSINPLCDLIISAYAKNNDHKAAVILLKKMEEAQIKPSGYFKRIINDLVANNKQKLSVTLGE